MSNLRLASHLEEISERIKVAEPDKPRSAESYYKAADLIRKQPKIITSGVEAQGIKGIGEKIGATIGEFLYQGWSVRNENLKPLTPNIKSRTLSKEDEQRELFKNYLTKLYGFGKVKAENLVNRGFTNLEDIYYHAGIDNQMRMGIWWRRHMRQRIPRIEIDVFHIVISKLWSGIPDLHWTIAGSYRRNEPSSGDIDILVYSPHYNAKRLVESLKEFIVEILQLSDESFNGMIQLSPRHWARRIDIKMATVETWPFMLLYFTGSQQLNILMRQRAISMGLSLTGTELFVRDTKPKQKIPLNSEEAIFQYLGLKYLPPEMRLNSLKSLEKIF